MSYAEDLFELSLKLSLRDNVVYIKNYRPDLLKNETGYNLEYDFYIPSLKIAFEIQGQHHYDDNYQIKKDDLKHVLSKNNNIILFCLSIFQLSPDCVRKKLLNYSFKISKDFNLKPFNKIKCDYVRGLVKKYKENSINTYGDSLCQKSPQSLIHIDKKHFIEEFIKLNKCFNIMINNINTRCRFFEFTKRHICVVASSNKFMYIRYEKFYDSLIKHGGELDSTESKRFLKHVEDRSRPR